MKLTPGKLAGLKNVSNARGVIGAAAMDQRGSLKKALGANATEKQLEEFKSLVTAVHALDRVLMWNFYCVPQFNGGNSIPIGYWDRFGRPKIEPVYNQTYTSVWWIDPAKDAHVIASRAGLPMPTAAFNGASGATQ